MVFRIVSTLIAEDAAIVTTEGKFRRNVGNHVRKYTLSLPRRPQHFCPLGHEKVEEVGGDSVVTVGR